MIEKLGSSASAAAATAKTSDVANQVRRIVNRAIILELESECE